MKESQNFGCQFKFLSALVAMGGISWMLVGIGCTTSRGPNLVYKAEVEKEIPHDIAKSYEVTDQPRASDKKGLTPTILSSAGSVSPTDPGHAGPNEKKKKSDKREAKKKKGQDLSAAKSEGKTSTPDGTQAPSLAPARFFIPNRRPPSDPFRVGEKVTFDVTWLKTTAGELSLEMLPFKYIEGRKVYHFKGNARTTSIFARIYRAEDYVESFVDYEGMFPFRFVLHGDESKHLRDTLELFDHAQSKQYIFIKDDRLNGEVHEDRGYRDLTPFSQDGLSSLFFVRTFKLEPGQTMKVPMTTSGTQSEALLTGDKVEDVRTKAGTFKAVKTRIEIFLKGKKQPGDAFFWVTDDDRRFIVKFEAKVRIGWVAGVAKKVELGQSTSD